MALTEKFLNRKIREIQENGAPTKDELTILESGGRKSEIEKHCTKPIVELEKRL